MSQEIGITTIKVDYHWPAVRNRNIFGALVPYDQIWRAGAEESTTITIMDSVTIDGNPMAPGKYGLHIIPKENSFVVIFSNNHTQWGSFFYDKAEDVLRVEVPIMDIDFTENLRYQFDLTTENSADLIMKWADKGLRLSIEVNEISTTLAVIRDELRTLPRFTWRGSREAALFCWLHDTHLKEALEWIDLSISYEERFENVFVKSRILNAMGKLEEAQRYLTKAKMLGGANNMIFIAREVIGHHNSPEKAIEVLNVVSQNYPENYETHYYKGVAYGWLGKMEIAKSEFLKSTKLARTQKEKERVLSRMNEFRF